MQVAVDRRSRDAELVGDLLHGVRPVAVGSELVLHVLRDLRLPSGELGLLTSRPPAGASGVQAVAGALGHECVSNSAIAPRI